jgi:hypothetical protein
MYSGRVGDIVLRNYGGKSVMAKRPDCSKVVKSPAQLENQKKFAKAVRSSKTVKNNPQRFEYYSKKKKKKKYLSAYHAAMSDFMTKPKVQKVDLVHGYRGQQGNVIRISAWDKFRVETVSVMILNKIRVSLLRKARLLQGCFRETREWDYISTVENVDYKSCRILVQV